MFLSLYQSYLDFSISMSISSCSMWKNIFVFIVSLHVFDLYSQNINHYSGTDVVFDFANEEVVLKSSWIKSKEELNSEFVSSLEPDRLLHDFRITAQLPSGAKPLEGLESPQIGLRGHFVGHYLSTLAVLVARNDVPLLAKKVSDKNILWYNLNNKMPWYEICYFLLQYESGITSKITIFASTNFLK